LKAWQEGGGLREPEAVKAATEAYRGDMDTLRDFLEDCCVLAPTFQVPYAELYPKYEVWCNTNGERPLGKKNFSQRLCEKKGIYGGKTREGARGFSGIGLKPDRD